ncbi:helix-turn-helix domain-containing protein [Flavobacterium macacae]|uniref:XRE family transcriptional regulator n=1 Tax=Flavobacterium macacae TaxID=2488993 RepID=A0A3P3W9R9_9FLAO|nr:helix-turn-helix transcriptional regulator [Flavobacterium macacae]RRJ90756.1 XRE family transcriptional regulator [Flavobacterium macacae]
MKTDEENKFLRSVGVRIRSEREKLGISQEALGLEVGLSKNQVGRIERAQHATSVLILHRMAIFFEIDIKTFFVFEYA